MGWFDTKYNGFFPPMPRQNKSGFKQHEVYCVTQEIPPRKARSRTLRTLLREWRWELATWLLGTCALVGIVTLVAFYRDRPLKEWTLNIRLATLVAALSQIAQSSLLVSVASCIGQLKWNWFRKKRPASDLDTFEEASRGPNGSLRLLLRSRLHLASLGALATVLLLAFSPFAQQSNTIQLRVVKSTTDSDAAIGRSVHWINNKTEYVFQSPAGEDEFGDMVGSSPYLEANARAVLAGIMDKTNSISDVVGTCQADACTWDDYATIGICASVEDISSRAELIPQINDTRSARTRIAGVSWSPPVVTRTSRETFWMAAPSETSRNYARNETVTLISEIYVGYLSPCDRGGQPWSNITWGGYRKASDWTILKGTLNVCVQTLKSSFNNSMRTEIVESRSDLRWDNSNEVCISEPYKGDKFCVGSRDIMQWSYLLKKSVKGAAELNPGPGGSNVFKGQWTPLIVNEIVGPMPLKCNSTLFPSLGIQGFTRRINSIATSMSNTMRLGSSRSPATLVKGTQWTSEQYVAVQFYWLFYPCAVYLVITVFLFTTIFISRKADVPLWKSSPLVLLHANERDNDIQTLKGATEDAETKQVQLQYSGENWYIEDVTGK